MPLEEESGELEAPAVPQPEPEPAAAPTPAPQATRKAVSARPARHASYTRQLAR